MPPALLRCFVSQFLRNTIMCLFVSLVLTPFVHAAAEGMCGCEHRYGLLMEFYHATNGPMWTNRTGWGTTTPCSTDWYGVTCTSGDITQVRLSGNNLSGTLPSSLSTMTSLVFLILNSNCLHGTVPVAYGALPLLQQMSLCNTKVSGGFHLVGCTGVNMWPLHCKSPLTNAMVASLSSEARVLVANVSFSTSISTGSRSHSHATTISQSHSHATTISQSQRTTRTITPATCAVNATEIALVLSGLHAPFVGVTRATVVITASTEFRAQVDAGNHTVVSAISSPIEREVLLNVPNIALNLTYAVPPPSAVRWVVEHIQVGGQSLSFTDESPNTAAWHSLVISPSAAQAWLPPETSLFVGRSIPLVITLSCDGAEVLIVYLLVPAPGVPRDFAGRVAAGAGYAQLASVLAGGATSGTALGRIMATRSMVICDADAAISGGVLDLDLQICATAGYGDAAETARSAVLSNFVLLAVVGVSMFLLAFLWAHFLQCPRREAFGVMSLPSTLFPVSTVVLPSTAASVVVLLARVHDSPCTAVDVVLVVIGVVLVLLPTTYVLALCFWHTFRAGAKWAVRGREVTTVSPAVRNNQLHRKMFLAFRDTLQRRWKWEIVVPSSSALPARHESGNGSLRFAWVLLLEYRVLWYGAFDSAMLLLVAALASVSGLQQTFSLCIASGACIVFLYAAQLVVLVLSCPFTTIFSLVHAAACISLTCLSATAQFVFVVTASSTDASGLWLAELSAACDMTVVGITAVRIAIDIFATISAVRRRLVVILRNAKISLRTRRATMPDGSPNTLPLIDQGDALTHQAANVDLLAMLAAGPSSLGDLGLSDDDKFAAGLELQFWDDNGFARVQETGNDENDDEEDLDLLRTTPPRERVPDL